MDAFEPERDHGRGVPDGTPSWRTDLYSTSGTLMTHAEASSSSRARRQVHAGAEDAERGDAVRRRLHAGALRAADDRRVQGGRRRSPRRVFPQSFLLDDVLYWIEQEPAFGARPSISTTQTSMGLRRLRGAVVGMQELAEGVASSRRRCWTLVELAATRSSLDVRDGLPRPRASTSSPGRSSAPGSTDGGGYYYQSVKRRDQQRRRHPRAARRPGPAGRHPGHLLRLAGDGHLLRQLHCSLHSCNETLSAGTRWGRQLDDQPRRCRCCPIDRGRADRHNRLAAAGIVRSRSAGICSATASRVYRTHVPGRVFDGECRTGAQREVTRPARIEAVRLRRAARSGSSSGFERAMNRGGRRAPPPSIS